MSDLQLKIIEVHVAACPTCSKANRRVNDFCSEGRLLFAEWAQTHEPTSMREVELSDEQFSRLVAEQRRADRSGQSN